MTDVKKRVAAVEQRGNPSMMQVVRHFGRHPALDAAVRFHAAGDLANAEASCRKALADTPNDPTATLMLAELALGIGDSAGALDLIGRVLTVDPNLPLAHFALGRAHHMAEQLEPARDAYRQAVRLRPDFATAHCNLSLVLNDMNEHKEALAAARRAMELDPNIAETHMAVGLAMAELEQPQIAIAALRRATELGPNLSDAFAALGRVLQKQNDLAGAVVAYRRAIQLKPDASNVIYRLGVALQLQEKTEEAIAEYRRALDLTPGSDIVWNSLGGALRSIGRFEEATSCFRKAVELNPTSGMALRNLAVCETATGDDAELAAMVAVADDEKLPNEERVSAAFAVGKWLDDAGRYDDAFARYVQANALSRQAELAAGARFDAVDLRNEINEIAETFTPDFFAARHGWGVLSETPVFIVGLFRSGTTLVEQIAASHPLVFGAGELTEIRTLTARLTPTPNQAVTWKKEAIQAAAKGQLGRLEARDKNAIRVSDKNPDNIFSLGMIATMFPNARVVFLHREPRDSALSCFVQAFSKRQAFASDLADCATRWAETERLAAIWRRQLPLRMLDIQYETLVEDLEGQSRRLIDFLGLEWDPACLNFHETERTVRTASTWQVRQPIYTSSIGRWRNYERHLGPMLKVFHNYGVKLD
jgi:tetratricopeptide (TPR) repeat protein